MSNIYVTRMKNALNECYKRELQFANMTADIYERFSADYAEGEAARVRAQSEDCCRYYKNQIKEAFEEARELLAIANFPDPQWLTADRHVFELNSPFRLSPQEVKIYVDRYSKRGNFAMLRMIQDWISQHDLPNRGNPLGDIKIFLPSDHLMIYKKFADSALSQIETIHQGAKAVNPSAVSCYADENFASEWFGIIGDGTGLKVYQNASVEDTVKRTFDTVTLSI